MIAVSVNSGLGSLTQAHLICEALKKVSLDKNAPVFTFAEDQAFGAGYYILSTGNKVFCDQNSLIGGIGACYRSFGLKKFADSYNLKITNISKEKFKLRLDMFDKLHNEDVEWIEKVLKHQHDEFKKHVEGQRGHKIQKKAEVMEGNIFIGEQAVKQGLVDELGEMCSISRRDFGDTQIYNLTRQGKQCHFLKAKILQDILVNEQLNHSDFENLLEEQWVNALNERKMVPVLGDFE